MFKILSLCVIYLASASAFAFGNQDVVQLLAAGMDEKTVTDAIAGANPATFDTSAQGLIALKQAGASPAVIQKVIARQAASNAPARAAQSADGVCQFESAGTQGEAFIKADGKVIGLFASKYDLVNNINMGTGLLTALTAGIVSTSGTQSVVLTGNRAKIRIADKAPAFLDLLETPDHAPGDRTFLLRMTAKDTSRTAESEPISVGLTPGKVSKGFSKEALVPVSIEREGDVCTYNSMKVILFRMKPAEPLASGEYALTVGNKIYDFGVD